MIYTKINNFITKLSSIPMESVFKEQIDKILSNIEYSCINITIDDNKLTILESNNNVTHTICINKNSVEFHTYYTNNYTYNSVTNDEVGKLYKDGNNLITKYCSSEVRSYENYQEIKTEETISAFDENLVEISKTTKRDVKNYHIEDGIKTLIQYEYMDFPNIFYNNLQTKKYTRTPDGNVIVIEETEYHDDPHKKYNNRIYCIGYNSGDKHIHIYGNFTIVGEDLYLDYINGKITEEELFKHFVKLRSSGICC